MSVMMPSGCSARTMSMMLNTGSSSITAEVEELAVEAATTEAALLEIVGSAVPVSVELQPARIRGVDTSARKSFAFFMCSTL